MEKAFIFFFHFFQIERVQKTWFELLHHEKRQSFFSPLLSLTLLLFPFPTTPFELFFFLSLAISFFMTSLSAALPMRASSRTGEC